MGSKSKQFTMKSSITYQSGREIKKSKKACLPWQGKTLPDIISK
jgi:hypothetical protein